MATFQVCQPTGWTGLVVGCAVVRSLVDLPDAGASGGDYLGGSCLHSWGRLVILAGGYVDKEVTGYVDIGWALKSPTKVPVGWVVSSCIVLRHRRWMGRITGLLRLDERVFQSLCFLRKSLSRHC